VSRVDLIATLHLTGETAEIDRMQIRQCCTNPGAKAWERGVVHMLANGPSSPNSEPPLTNKTQPDHMVACRSTASFAVRGPSQLYHCNQSLSNKIFDSSERTYT
jgi:hypothetical protein